MTTEEKAKELIERFKKQLKDSPNIGRPNSLAKACAIICVDEILEEYGTEFLAYWEKERVKFWQSVRAYIEGSK